MVQRELTGQGVYLGRQGDDADIQVYVDLTDWLEEYGAGYGVMLFTSPDGKTWPLYTEVDADGKKMTGEITQTETARFGNGVIEARWMAGGTMMASEKYNAYILPQAFKGEVPRHITPSWVQELILGFETSAKLIDEARAVTYAAKEARDAAKESQTEAQESAASAGASAATATQAAETATQKADSIPADFTGLVEHIAGIFDATTAYSAGDYVWYSTESKLYRFTADHAAGAWVGTDAEEVTVTDEHKALENHVEFLTDENYTAQSGTDMFEIGRILHSSGAANDAEPHALRQFRTKEYLDGAAGVHAKDGYRFYVFAYRKTANKAYVGVWNGTQFVGGSGAIGTPMTGSLALSTLGDYYFKVCGTRPDATENVTTEDFDKVEILYGTKATNADFTQLGNALGNANDFAVTNFANGARGKQDGYSYVVNNYTVIGITNASICVSGNPNLKPIITDFASLPDDYYTIPLIGGKTYTLVAFVTGQTGTGNISFYLANKTDKAEIVQCTYNIVPSAVHDTIVYNNFIAPTDDMYALKVYIRSQEDKVVKVAIYPQDCLYQRFAALNTSLAGAQTSIDALTAKDTAIDGQLATLAAADTAMQTQISTLTANSTAMQGEIDTLTASDTEKQTAIDGTVEAFNNANAFAITSYGRGTKGTENGMSVNNFTIEGTGSGIVVLTGNPGISPTSVSIASMTDDYFTIPLDSEVTYTLALFVDDPQEAGQYIRIVAADLTTKKTKMLCNLGPDAMRNSIVTYDFTVDSTDKYMLQAHITNSKDKTIKVAILPPGNPYKLAAQNESTIKSIKLESTGDITDRTAEILARLTANGYCELGNGIFVVSNLEMPGGTELRGQGNATVLRLGTTLTSGSVILATSRCTVRDLTIMGADSDISFTSESTVGNKHGIKIDLYNNIDVNISNVRIKRFDGYGLYVRGFGQSASTPPQYSNCNANNCFIDNCFAGIYCGSLLQNSVFTNCHCTNGVFGAYTVGRCHFEGCMFMDNLEGVHVKGYGASFNGCLFHDEANPAKEYALVAEDVQYFALTVTGCRFYYCGAIQTTSTGSGTKNMALFIGCSMYGMALPITCGNTAGILFEGCLFGTDVTASGNIQETTAGTVKLKNCYKMDTGAVLER